ncbi:hypothetical protein NON20_06025 [Synechocystis sp. B12]|nr:hypothetical protein NON20_06025 [Synechocystis sp. B12]
MAISEKEASTASLSQIPHQLQKNLPRLLTEKSFFGILVKV